MTGIFKWILIPLLLTLWTSKQVAAQTRYNVVFYNVENLFDTWDDPATADEEFTPHNIKHWTRDRFDTKIRMIFKALITAGNGQFPDIIGFAEVENRWVIEQLIAKTPLSKFPYEIIHKDSPDPRGIDVALIYRKDRVTPVDFDFIPVPGDKKYGFNSRDILHFTARLGNNQIHFFVNHWPSRSGGYLETKEKRNIAARILKKSVDSLMVKKPDCNLLLMGDFNATPDEECFTSILRALPYADNNDPSSLINLSTLWSSKADGTIRNGGQWSIFDQMICSGNLLSNSALIIDTEQSGICKAPFLLEPDPTFLGSKPYRTYLGPTYHGGISDHLPIRVCLSQK